MGKRGGHQMEETYVRKGILKDNTLEYYRQATLKIKQGFESSEESDIFYSNVFKQLSTEGIEVCQNQTCSSTVEQLVSRASLSNLVLLLDSLSTDLEMACTDRFASHCLQTTVLRTAELLGASQGQKEEEINGHALLRKLCDHLLVNMSVHMYDTYTSHVLRCVLQILAGHVIEDNIIRSKVSRNQQAPGQSVVKLQSLGADYDTILEKFANGIVSLKRMNDHACNTVANPVLQTLVVVLRKRDAPNLAESLLTLINKLALDGDGNKELLLHAVGSHLVEQLLLSGNEPVIRLILEANVLSREVDLATHPIGNFVLQQACKCCVDPEMAKRIVDSIAGGLETILPTLHYGVLVAVAQLAANHQCGQKRLVKSLQAAFQCRESVALRHRLVPALLALLPMDHRKDDVINPLPKLHGSLLLQQLVRFKNTTAVAASMASLAPEELLAIACDARGSRFVDAFWGAEAVPAEQKRAICDRLQGSWSKLACNRAGSRCFENMWLTFSHKQKVAAAKELVAAAKKLQGDQFGRIIWSKLDLALYQSKPDVWKRKRLENQAVPTNAKTASLVQDNAKTFKGKKRKRPDHASIRTKIAKFK